MEISEPAEYALLGLLWNGPRHGYELHRFFAGEQELGSICHLEQSQLYAFLKKLERLGYIESTLEPQEGRPPRRVVGLSTKGRQVFRQWVEAPTPRPREVRLLFLLKLYFARSFGTATIGTLISRQIQACEVFLKKVEDAPPGPEHLGQTLPPSEALQDFRIIVHQARIHQIKATIAWLKELQDQADAIALPPAREKSAPRP